MKKLFDIYVLSFNYFQCAIDLKKTKMKEKQNNVYCVEYSELLKSQTKAFSFIKHLENFKIMKH